MAKEVILPQDCRTCGLCCIANHDQEAWADITEKDMVRLGPRFVRLHVIQPRLFDVLAHSLDGHRVMEGVIKTKRKTQKAGPMKGWQVVSCVALRGRIQHKVSCSVYEKRPEVCRKAVVAGDRACRDIRKEFNQWKKEQDL